jgi:hypothetical protein
MAMLAAAAVLFCSLAACGSKEIVQEADMPYGSTMVLALDKAVPIQYDDRFIAPELVKQIADYYHSVQEDDAEQYKPLPFPLYHQYQLETVYEKQFTDEQLVQYTYDYFKNFNGEDFDFALIDITNAVSTDGVSETRDALMPELDKIADEQGKEPVSAKTEALIEMSITCYLTNKGLRRAYGN